MGYRRRSGIFGSRRGETRLNLPNAFTAYLQARLSALPSSCSTAFTERLPGHPTRRS